MDDMLAQVLAMADQTSDTVESLTMLATALAIDEQCSLSEADLCRHTEKGIKSASASTLTDADALTLGARAIAIFLEKQAAHHLQVAFTATLSRQLSVIMRYMPRSTLVAGVSPSSTTNNANTNSASSKPKPKAASPSSSSASSQQLLRFTTLTPVDFIEEVLRILQVYSVFRKSFAGVMDMPPDATLLHNALEWLPHVNRRVFPQLAAFCCGRIVCCSTQHARLDRSADLFLNRILRDELAASFQQEIIRIEHLFRIAVCFAARGGCASDAATSSASAFSSPSTFASTATAYFGGLFSSSTSSPSTTTTATATTTTANSSSASVQGGNPNDGHFVERLLRIILDHLVTANVSGTANQTSASVLTLTLRMITSLLYNNQSFLSLIAASPSFSTTLQSLLKMGLLSSTAQASAELSVSASSSPPLRPLSSSASSPISASSTSTATPVTEATVSEDAAALSALTAASASSLASSLSLIRMKKLQLPSLFASSSSGGGGGGRGGNNNAGVGGAGAGQPGGAGLQGGANRNNKANSKEYNGGVNDDTTLVLTALSLLINNNTSSGYHSAFRAPAAAASAPASATAQIITYQSQRIEPHLRWTWSSGEAAVDYGDDSCSTITRAFFSSSSSPPNPSTGGARGGGGISTCAVPIHTPGGRFSVSFEYMAQLNGENKRPRAVTCSFLPEKLALATPGSGQYYGEDGTPTPAPPAAAASAANDSSQQRQQPAALHPKVVDFLKSLFSFAGPDNNNNNNNNNVNRNNNNNNNNNRNNNSDVDDAYSTTVTTLLSELWSLRSGDYEHVVEAVFLRLLQLGVWQELPAASARTTVTSSAATAATLFFGSILVELLQNSPFAAATVECIQKSILEKLSSSPSSSSVLFDRWSAFLKSSGFSDILAASVQLPKETENHDEEEAVAEEANKQQQQVPAANNNNKSRRRGGNTNATAKAAPDDDGAGHRNANNNALPIDPKIAAKLLSMIGDCIESTSHHTIAQIMKRVAELSPFANNNANDDNLSGRNLNSFSSPSTTSTSSAPSRELRTLLSEFAKSVRTGRSQPRNLLKEIVDTGVKPHDFAAFIASDASLPKTLCRIAASSCFGAQPSNRPSPSQAMGTLTSCAHQTIKLYATPTTTCINNHNGGLSLQSSSPAGSKASVECCLCKTTATKASTMYRCSVCSTWYCPSCVGADGGGGGVCEISALACVGDWLRSVTTSSSSTSSSASATNLTLIKADNALLANSFTIPLSTPIAALETVLSTAGGGGRGATGGGGAGGDVSNIFGRKKVSLVVAQRKQLPDLHLQASIRSVFVREPGSSSSSSSSSSSISSRRHHDTNDVDDSRRPPQRGARHDSSQVPNVATPSASSSFGHQDVIHLRFLQQVCSHTLAETFTEELSSWLQTRALDVCLGGMIGLHRKVHDCLPALKLAVPLSVRFDFWRYATIGGHRRALNTVGDKELGTGGNISLEVSTRQMDKFALGVARIPTTSAAASASSTSSSSLIGYFHHHLGEVLVAPIHRRMDLYFKDEVGRGEGPTQEVYSEVARQVCSSPKLWVNEGNTLVRQQRESSASPSSFRVAGYIPAGGSDKEMYTLGVLCGRALLDGFIVSVPFHELVFTFLTCASNQPHQQDAVRDVMLSEVVDPAFFRNVTGLAKMSDKELAATGLEGEDGDGDGVALNKKNVGRYIEHTLAARFAPIKAAIEQFGRGVQRVVDFNFLKACFENHELPAVLGGVSASSSSPLFTAAELESCIVPAHGYTHQCPQIQWLKEALLAFTPELQSDFVEFLTGSRGLPAGGIINLNSAITVAKKQFDEGDTNAKQGTLPSCSTCFLYVKLPPYNSLEILKTRLLTAIQEGRRNFSHS